MDETQWSLDPKLVYNALRNTGHFFDWFQTLVPDYEFVEGIYAMDRGDPHAQKVPFVKPVQRQKPQRHVLRGNPGEGMSEGGIFHCSTAIR